MSKLAGPGPELLDRFELCAANNDDDDDRCEDDEGSGGSGGRGAQSVERRSAVAAAEEGVEERESEATVARRRKMIIAAASTGGGAPSWTARGSGGASGRGGRPETQAESRDESHRVRRHPVGARLHEDHLPGSQPVVVVAKSNRVMRTRASMCVDAEGRVVVTYYRVEEDDFFVDDDGQFIQTCCSHDALGDGSSKNTVASVNDDFNTVNRLFHTSPKEGDGSARDASRDGPDDNDAPAPREEGVSAEKTEGGGRPGGHDHRRAAFARRGNGLTFEDGAAGPDRLRRQAGLIKMLGFRRLSQVEMDGDLSHQLETKIHADQDAKCQAVVEEARRIMDDVNKSTAAMGLEAPFCPVDETFPPMRKLHTNIGCQMEELEATTGLPHAKSREALRQKKSKEGSGAASSLMSSLGKDHAASLRSSFGSAMSTSSGSLPRLNDQEALTASLFDQITLMQLREDDISPSLSKLHTSYLPNFMWYQPVAADSSPAGMMRPTALCSGTGISDHHCLDPDMLNVLSTFGPYLLGSEHLFQGENDDDAKNDATGNKRRLAFWVEPIDENEAENDSVGEGTGGGDVNLESSADVDGDDSARCKMSWLRR